MDLLDAAADGEDFGHARDALQAAGNGPLGEGAEVHRGDGVVLRAQADEKNFTHQRGNGGHAGARARGQTRGLKALLDELAGLVNVGAPRELDEDQREADVGVRAQAVEPADA